MSCTYMSAMIILIANKLTTSEHNFSDQVEADDLLIDEALDFIDQMARALDDDRLRRLCTGCQELNARATNAVMSTRFGGTWKSKASLRPWPSLEEFYNTTTERERSREKVHRSGEVADVFGSTGWGLGKGLWDGNPTSWPSQYARLDDLGITDLSRSTETCSVPHYLGLIP